MALFAVTIFGMMVVIDRCTPEDQSPNSPEDQHHTPVTYHLKYVPLPAETVYVSSRPRPARIDTVEIVREYFAEHIYNDTVLKTDTALLVLRDTVWANGIAGREVTLTFNADRFARRNSVGLLTSYSSNHAALLGAYRRDNWIIAAGYDFPQHSPTIMAGYLYNW